MHVDSLLIPQDTWKSWSHYLFSKCLFGDCFCLSYFKQHPPNLSVNKFNFDTFTLNEPIFLWNLHQRISLIFFHCCLSTFPYPSLFFHNFSYWPLWYVFFFQVLLRHNGHIALYKFKVYSIIILITCMIKMINNKFSKHPSYHIDTKLKNKKKLFFLMQLLLLKLLVTISIEYLF